MSQKTYIITMERTYSTTFEIEANDPQDAMQSFEKIDQETKLYQELEQCCIVTTEIFLDN